MGETPVTIEPLPASALPAHLDELAALLNACVHAGASISFVLPHTIGDSVAFWRSKVFPSIEADHSLLVAAKTQARLAGCVLLGCDTPPNQPHRAEVSKLLVHPDFRRRGIARALMLELERRAVERGRSLITLDTRTGDNAEPLYRALGYETVGVISGFAVDPFDPAKVDPTTIMYKAL